MKRSLLAACFTLSCLAYFAFAKDDKVYVCVSPTAHAYHASKDCAGLARCTHKIVSTTKDSAVKVYHHDACKKCY